MKNTFEFEGQSIEKGVLVAALKEKGLDDPGASEELMAWLRGVEDEADRENTSRANIEADIEKARLFAEAGIMDEARDYYGMARYAAYCDNEKELFEQIDKEMEGLSTRINNEKEN